MIGIDSLAGKTIKSTFHAESLPAAIITKLLSDYCRAVADQNARKAKWNAKVKRGKLASRICEKSSRGIESSLSFQNNFTLPAVGDTRKAVYMHMYYTVFIHVPHKTDVSYRMYIIEILNFTNLYLALWRNCCVQLNIYLFVVYSAIPGDCGYILLSIIIMKLYQSINIRF